MKQIVLFIFMILIIASANAEISNELITFRGIPLGKPGVSETLLKLCTENKGNLGRGLLNSCDRKNYKKNYWSFSVDYGNLVNTYVSFQFDDQDAIQIIQVKQLPKTSVPELVAAMESKYGKPEVTNNAVENKLGMKFDNTVYKWIDSEGNRLTVESIYDQITNGRVIIESSGIVQMNKKLDEVLKDVRKQNL